MKKTRGIKVALSLALVILLLVTSAVTVMAFPALNGASGKVYAWNGRSTGASGQAGLRAYRIDQPIKALGGGGSNWSYKNAPHGDQLLTIGTSYCLNIYRVLQPNGYYHATGYPYEDATSGRDQRIVRSAPYIRLAQPLVGGTWFLVADKSNPSADSDVIWYTSSSGDKAKWI